MSEGIEITKNASCEADTEEAIRVTSPDFDFDKNPCWFPKSVIHDDSEVWQKGTRGTLIVKHWFAENNGWI